MVNQFQAMRDLYSSTANTSINADRQVRDVSDVISLLDPNNAPLTTLLRKLRKKKSTDVKFEWFEDEFPTQNTTCTEDDASSGDTAIGVTDGTLFREGDVWLNADNRELIYIDNASTANQISCVRGVGGTAPADWGTNDELFYVGNGAETGEVARKPLTTITVTQYNYCQIFKEAFEITNTMNATNLYGGPDRQYLRRKHGDLHQRDIERAFWWGGRDRLVTTDSSRITRAAYLTGGVFRKISTNDHVNVSSALTEDEFDGYLRGDFRYGNAVKFMFCSPLAMSVISSWGRDKIRLVPRDKTYGIHISRFISPHGELNLINNKLFYDFTLASQETAIEDYGTCSVILDLESMMYRYLRDTRLEMNIQENDRDSTEDQFLTECGLHMEQEKHHASIFGWALS
jgi:hypothetical protein